LTSITRRQFLKGSINLMGAVSLARVVDLSDIPLQVKAGDNLPAAAAVLGTDLNTPAEILKSALAAVGGITRFVKPGQVVAIKPNATWAFAPHTASSTDPDLLRALIELVKEAGASRIIVTDHCSIEPGTNRSLQANGLGAVVEETGAEGHFPDRYLAPKDTYTIIDLPEGHAFKKIGVVKAAVEADVRINMGLAKCHSVTRMTLVLKHMMGFLEAPGSLHSNIHKGIADINSKSPIQADLHILEALRVRMAYGDYVTCGGPETDETHPFMIKRMNQIIVGTDPVLVDAYACSTFFDVKPKEFAHLKNASDWGIGDLEVEAAKTSGKLRILKVGDVAAIQPTTQPAAQPVEISTSEAAESKKAAAIPLPDLAPVNQIETVKTVVQPVCNNVISPDKFLNVALIPASVVLAGAGLIAARKKPKPTEPVDDGLPLDENK
jgi:uncharacterized protein (DUF362 family)